jgi:SRSO17 transposase
LTTDELRAAAHELVRLHERFAPCFGRLEAQAHARVYVQGLLLHPERKSAEPLALHYAAPPGQPKSPAEAVAMQRFLTASPWPAAAVQGEIQAVFRERLQPSAHATPVGTVGVLDESSFVKRGRHSAGVARQHCGRLGKVENCQVGVFLIGVTPAGTALLDHQLYLPPEWAADAERRAAARVPAGQEFLTKPQIAQRLLERATVAFDWITADDLYGRNGAFLAALEERQQKYVAEAPGCLRVWRDDPRRWQGEQAGTRRPSRQIEAAALVRLDRLAAELPEEAWQPLRLREGAAGPLVFEFARRRVWAVRRRRAGPPVWVVFQRSLGPERELRYYFSNAPVETPLESLAQVVACRWRVEEVFEDAKGYLGMADYEARGWTSWHHHMSLVALAHLYVTLTRQQWQPGTPRLTLDMAVRLLKASLPRPRLKEEDAVHLIEYHLRRNATAQASHRKTWIANHPGIAEKLLL